MQFHSTWSLTETNFNDYFSHNTVKKIHMTEDMNLINLKTTV